MMLIKNRTALLIRSNGYTNEANRMDRCGVRHGPYGPSRCLCGSTNWCPNCISFRAFKLRQWLKLKVLPSAPRKLTWLHITSTAKNCAPGELNQYVQAAITGTARLFKHPNIKPIVVGTVSALEYKPADEPSLTMAHTHSLVGLQIKRGDTVPSFETWLSLWLALCPAAMGRDINVREVNNRADMEGVANYLTKDSEYNNRARDSFIDRWDARLDEPDRFLTEVNMTTRKKRYFGSLARPRTYAERSAWVAPWK